MLSNFTDDLSTLVQVMAWYCLAASHYLNQCWLSSMIPYGVSSHQRVKYSAVINNFDWWFQSFFQLTSILINLILNLERSWCTHGLNKDLSMVIYKKTQEECALTCRHHLWPPRVESSANSQDNSVFCDIFSHRKTRSYYIGCVCVQDWVIIQMFWYR